MRALLVLLLLATAGCLGDRDVVPEDWPDGTPRLQPGSQLYIHAGDTVSQCTAGFMFRSADNATLYLSLSAHCIGRDHGAGIGSPVYDRMPGFRTKPIGTVAYDGWADAPGSITRDFALVALSNREGVRENASPAVKHWQGPLGLADSSLAAPGQRVAAYGASMQRGEDHPDNPRLGRFVLNDGGELRITLDKASVKGDSGGPVMTWDGQAFGLLHGGPESGIPVVAPNGLDVFTPLDTNLQRARQQLPGLELVTWDSYAGPSLPV